MTRAGLVRLAAWAGLLLSLGSARAETLVVALADPAGAYASALNRVVLRSYAASNGQKVQVVALGPGVAWDVAQLDPVALDVACARGDVAKVDWGSMGGHAGLVTQAVSDCGVGAYVSSTVLTWDAAKVPGAPNWGDFWNVVRIPGRRGLRKSPVGTLEIALMADGVAQRDVYTVLRAHDGVERAFRKLDQLRPYVVWWQRDSEPMGIVASRGAVMSSAPNERVIAAERKLHQRFEVQWNGSIAVVQSWAVRATTRLAAPAWALIRAASGASAQAEVLSQTGLGATANGVEASEGAAAPDAHLGTAVPFDGAFWRDNQAALTMRFDAWLKH
jgi:putative spermidine/putrescine transport system substrate-binding protein